MINEQMPLPEKTSHVLGTRGTSLVAAATGGLLLLLYAGTLCLGVAPGESALLMARTLGIYPPDTPAHPLWRALVGAWGHLPSGTAPWSLNLLSACCGALAMGLLCRYVMRWLHARIDVETLDSRPAWLASALAGIVAALAAGTSQPIWTAATRLHYLSFDLLLLMVAFNLLQDYEHQGRRLRAYLLAFLCGVGAVESIMFLLLAPFLITSLFIALYNRGQIPWRTVTGLAVTGLAGASLYALAAWLFAGTVPTAPGEASAPWVSLMVDTWRNQLGQIRACLPRVGWLTLGLTVIAPWVVVLFVASSALNRTVRDATYDIFHLALTALCLAGLLRAPFLSWTIVSGARLPVLEMTLVALTTGYLAGYWTTRFFDRLMLEEVEAEARRSAREERQTGVRHFARTLAAAVGILLAVTLAAATLLNASLANGRRGQFVDRYAQALLDRLGTRTWLATDGLVDPHLAILASRSGRTLHLVNLIRERSPATIQRLQQSIRSEPLFAANRVRLLNTASLGASAFIQEWLSSDASAGERLAIMTMPDFWVEAGYTPMPEVFFYSGAHSVAGLTNGLTLETHTAAWQRLKPLLGDTSPRDPTHTLRNALRHHLARLANDLGVVLEDAGQGEPAYEAYRLAGVIAADNLSAKLNRLVLVHKGMHPAERDEVEGDVAEVLASWKKREPSVTLTTRLNGYVRSPDAFVKLGLDWSRLGQPGMAAAALQRATRLVPDNVQSPYQFTLASLHMEKGAAAQSTAIYRRALAENATNAPALLGLLEIALAAGQADEARAYLKQARAAGVPAEALALDDAAIDLVAGRTADAEKKLRALTDQDAKALPAWLLLVSTLVASGKAVEAETQVLPRLRAVAGKDDGLYFVFSAEAAVARARGPSGYRATREALRRALGRRPGTRAIMEELLRIDFALRDRDSATRDARELLRLDRNDAFGNYVMGSLATESGQFAAAEDFLRRSVESQPTLAAWNDLAELLRRSKRLPEAELAVQQALKLQPDESAALDTWACILLDAGRLPEAAATATRALAKRPNDPRLQLTDARVKARAGNAAGARLIVQNLRGRSAQLPPALQTEIETLAAELKR